MRAPSSTGSPGIDRTSCRPCSASTQPRALPDGGDPGRRPMGGPAGAADPHGDGTGLSAVSLGWAHRRTGGTRAPVVPRRRPSGAGHQHPRATGHLGRPADRSDRSIRDLVDSLPDRLAELASCGLPETLVRGDFHPGNWRYDGAHLVLLDWGDSAIGHPLLDTTSFLPRLPQALREPVQQAWNERGVGQCRAVTRAERLRSFGPSRRCGPRRSIDSSWTASSRTSGSTTGATCRNGPPGIGRR